MRVQYIMVDKSTGLWCSGRRGASMLARAAVGGALLCAGMALGASPEPAKELPGIISSKDAKSEVVALKPADVQFYLKIEHAALDRYQHPTPQDLKDMAEARRLHHLQMVGQVKLGKALEAGKSIREAAALQFAMTRDEQTAMDRGDALMSLQWVLAADSGMPREQWANLSETVETAAEIRDPADAGGEGPGGHSPSALSAEEIAAIDKAVAQGPRVKAANRQLVAPNAADIKKTLDLIQPLMMERMQANQAAMTP
jgi:hypothetical protein